MWPSLHQLSCKVKYVKGREQENLLEKAINGKELGLVNPDLALLICSHIWEQCVCMFGCFYKFIYLFILFLAVLGLRFCARSFSSCGEPGPPFIAVRGPLAVAASCCGAQAPDAQAQ